MSLAVTTANGSPRRPLPRPVDIKLIISDVDGTLLDSSHNLPTTNPTHIILNRLRSTYPSLPIVISTGKQYTATAVLRKQLNLADQYCCHLNGNVIYHPSSKILFQNELRKEVVRDVYEKAKEKNASFFVYDHAVVWQLHRGLGDEGIWAQKLRGYGEDVRDVTGEAESYLEKGGYIKMAVCQDEAALKITRQALEETFPEDAFAVVQALTFCAEMIPRANNKGTALAALLEILKKDEGLDIPRENVIAFGDGENDISMFKVAGMSVAMGNAMESARNAAVWSTETNDEGGVGKFLERIYWPTEN